MRQYGDWNGAREEMDARLHEAFSPIVPERENRELLFKSLTVQGNPAETSLANLRTAKQVADLYLIQVANRTWRRILNGREGVGEPNGRRFDPCFPLARPSRMWVRSTPIPCKSTIKQQDVPLPQPAILPCLRPFAGTVRAPLFGSRGRSAPKPCCGWLSALPRGRTSRC
jgi:hypothetical protein